VFILTKNNSQVIVKKGLLLISLRLPVIAKPVQVEGLNVGK